MSIQEQIKNYIKSQPQPKRTDMQVLHQHMLQLLPKSKLWFLNGKDDSGKTVSNPNIGYGLYSIQYADGTTRTFYQIGLSANTTGISVYIMGIKDKTYLVQTYGTKIGKASVSGYCIRFKTLKDINIGILDDAIRYGVEFTSNPKTINNRLKSKNVGTTSKDILEYNNAQTAEDKAICNLLSGEICKNLPEAENKIWHSHPVWFLDGNPVTGYSKQKAGIRLMFWSGADFDEERLSIKGKKFKDASIFYNSVKEINTKDLSRWLKKSKSIQWDYKNIVKRKGVLVRLK
ncbi:MAG: DUF1801 domain-containing protein [Agriterribacter sp.]